MFDFGNEGSPPRKGSLTLSAREGGVSIADSVCSFSMSFEMVLSRTYKAADAAGELFCLGFYGRRHSTDLLGHLGQELRKTTITAQKLLR